MGEIITKYGVLSFEELKAQLPIITDDYVSKSLQFCHEWLNNKPFFQQSTSGSTGTPKEIELKRLQMMASAKATCQFFDLKVDDTVLCCLNTDFIGGKMMLVRALENNMNLVLVSPGAHPFDNLPLDTRLHFASFVPLQFQKILESNNSQHILLLNNMKGIIVGGAPINLQLEKQIQSIECPVYSSYGMTETVSHIALRRINGNQKKSYFKTLPSIELKRDERNCLAIKGPVTNNVWIQTNDIVELISETEFNWIGRYDTLINSGGIKVSPEKLETILETILTTYALNSFTIIGLPHPTLGEAITLCIEGNEQPIKEKILDYLYPLITKYELPKAILFLETFPMLPSGKIDKLAIKKIFSNLYKKA